MSDPSPVNPQESFALDTWLTARTYADGDRASRPLAPVLQRATTFQAASAEMHRELYARQDVNFYQRFGHPGPAFVADRLAQLERGEAALLFASGMGAISTTLFTLLAPGDHIVIHHRVFAQTMELIREPLAAFGVRSTFVDACDPANVARAIEPGTRVVYLESPSNPWLDIQDIAAVAAIARKCGALLVVDSTFASPVLQKPLTLGADVVVHSATKFLGGHSDVMAGVVVSSGERISRIRRWQVLLGNVLDPEAAWLLFRGLRTLPMRVMRQSESAAHIAAALSRHAAVKRVLHPTCTGNAGQAVAKRQMLAGGGVVSFEMHDRASAQVFVDALRQIPIATSLGGIETIVELPYDLDFDGGSATESPALVRLSVGIEPVEPLTADLEQALSRSSRQ